MTTVGFVHAWHFMEGFVSAFLLIGLWKLIRWSYRKLRRINITISERT